MNSTQKTWFTSFICIYIFSLFTRFITKYILIYSKGWQNNCSLPFSNSKFSYKWLGFVKKKKKKKKKKTPKILSECNYMLENIHRCGYSKPFHQISLLGKQAWVELPVGLDHFHVCGYAAIICPRGRKNLKPISGETSM